MECYDTLLAGSTFSFFAEYFCSCLGANAHSALLTKEGDKEMDGIIHCCNARQIIALPNACFCDCFSPSTEPLRLLEGMTV